MKTKDELQEQVDTLLKENAKLRGEDNPMLANATMMNDIDVRKRKTKLAIVKTEDKDKDKDKGYENNDYDSDDEKFVG